MISLLKDAWNYLSGELATKGLAFISIPIFTRLLSPDEYGYLNVIVAISGILIPILTFNLTVPINRYYFEKEKKDFASFFTTSVLLSSILLFSGILILLQYKDVLSDFLAIPVEVFPFLCSTAVLLFISNLILVVHRARKHTRELRRVNVLKGYLGFLITLGIMVNLSDARYFGKLYSDLIVLVFLAVYFFWRFRRLFDLKLKINHIKYMFSYGIPLIPANLSAVLLMELDRVMINSYQGPSEAGLYSFAYNISMLLLILSNAVQYAFMPNFFKLMNDGKTHKIKEYFHLISSLISCGAVSLILFGPTIGLFLANERYQGGFTMIPIIVLGQYFLGYVMLYKQGISFRKKTIYSSITILSAGVLNTLLNAIYIPKYGASAGAITTVISYSFQFALTYIFVKFILKLDLLMIRRLLPNFILVMSAIGAYYILYNLFLPFFLDMALRSVIALILSTILILPYKNKIINYK